MNGCGPRYASNGGLQPERPRGLLASALRPGAFPHLGRGQLSSTARGFGTYRTLCVRTCDGYYFPISFSTVAGQVRRGRADLPADVPGRGGGPLHPPQSRRGREAMVSLAGEPYSALPTAFRYRQEYDKACTCRSATASVAPGFTEFPTIGSLDAVSSALDRIDPALAAATQTPMPRLRPAAGEDPETAANRAGELVPKPVAKPDGDGSSPVSRRTAARSGSSGPPTTTRQ